MSMEKLEISNLKGINSSRHEKVGLLGEKLNGQEVSAKS